jgi:hypothetical protein
LRCSTLKISFHTAWVKNRRSAHLRRETTLGAYAPMENDWWGIAAGDQDRMAVEQQGRIADRPNEHLGVSDCGIIQMRQMM